MLGRWQVEIRLQFNYMLEGGVTNMLVYPHTYKVLNAVGSTFYRINIVL